MGPRVTMSIWSSSYSLLCHDFRRKWYHWKEILHRFLKPAAPHFYDKKNRALALFEVPKRKSWKYAHHHILAFCGYLFRGEDVSMKFVISRYAHPAAAHSQIKIPGFAVFVVKRISAYLAKQLVILFNSDEARPNFEMTGNDTKFSVVVQPPCCPIKKSCFRVLLCVQANLCVFCDGRWPFYSTWMKLDQVLKGHMMIRNFLTCSRLLVR